MRDSSVSTYAQLPEEPLPRIVRRTATIAEISRVREKRQRFFVEKLIGIEILNPNNQAPEKF